MMIDHENKIVFVHLPKTGGSSVKKFMEDHSQTERPGRYQHPSKRPKNAIKRLTGYKYFTIVRNPYDRALSYYNCVYGHTDNNNECRAITELFDFYGTMSESLEKKRLKVFRFDMLNEVEKYLQHIYKTTDKLEHENKTELPNMKKTLNSVAKSKVLELFQDDFVRYGYDE